LNKFLCSLGIIWPTEAQPYLLKKCSSYFPATRSVAAFREVLLGKIDRLSPIVKEAYAVCTAWIFLTIILSAIVIRLKK
jgi:ABC-type polysaccharide/polyol phosphate export permease